MASVTTRPNGHRWVTFRAPSGKRQTIRLGPASASQADAFKVRVDRLLVAHRLGEIPDAATVEWLAMLADDLHDKLSRVGLCNHRGARTVGELVAWYLESHRAKPSTVTNWRVMGDGLIRYFGRERRINTITTDEVRKYREWLERAGAVKGGPLMATTITTTFRRAKQIFRAAVRKRWILDNPFDDERGWKFSNPARDLYIPSVDADRVIAQLPCAEMRLLVTLVRYAALRTPSEPLELEWTWLDWSYSTLFVKAPKTERYEGHETRIVPLCEEAMLRFGELWDQAPEGAVKVFDRLQVSRAAIADRLEAACRRAGIAMWGKPFINLRASCEYDWLRRHPLDEVAAWCGHSPETMLRHYNRVFKEQSARAAAQALQGQNGPKQVKQKAKRRNSSPRIDSDDSELIRTPSASVSVRISSQKLPR